MRVIETSNQDALPSAPVVSVGMLAYRHAEFIGQAIESVVNQKCNFPFELVIGEDRSPDGTLDVILEYQRRYPQFIRVLTSDLNVGMHANSTRCLNAARGEFMAYCEGDDYWCDPEKLSRQVAVMRSFPECSLVFHAAFAEDAESMSRKLISKWSPYPRFFTAEEIILGDGGLIPTASMMLRRKSIVAGLPSWAVDAVVPDYALALWCILQGRVAYIERPMSVYRTNVAASWSKRHLPELSYRLEHARRVEDMFEGFLKDARSRYRKEAARMVSKYYSDAFVRIPADRQEASEAFRMTEGKMIGSDRFLARLAALHGLKFGGIKSLIRKSISLLRLVNSMLISKRIPT